MHLPTSIRSALVALALGIASAANSQPAAPIPGPAPVFTSNPFGFRAHVWLEVTQVADQRFNVRINVGSYHGPVEGVNVADMRDVGRMVDVIAMTGIGRFEAAQALAYSFTLAGFGKAAPAFLVEFQ